MKAPSPIQYLLGNAVSLTVLVLGSIYMSYRWYQGDVSGWAAIIVIIITSTAAKANEAVVRHNAWKREWNQFGGPSAGWRMPRIPGLRLAFGIAAWTLLAVLALDVWDEDGMQWVAVAFWTISALTVVFGIAHRLRRAAAGSSTIVRVCLQTPAQSPNLKRAYAALPDYCLRCGSTGEP